MIEQEDERLDASSQRLTDRSPAAEPPRVVISPEQQHVIVHMQSCGHSVQTIAAHLRLAPEDVQKAIERGYPR